MEFVKFGELFDFASKSKMKAEDGTERGRYAFYTSSASSSKRTDEALYRQEALIVGTGGKVNIHYEDKPFSTSADCLVAIRKRGDFNVKYVYYFLLGNIDLLGRGFKGVTIKHISKAYIEQIEIQLHPIEIQDEIVAILDKATALLQKKRRMGELWQDLPRFLFLKMFGDPAEKDPGDWERLEHLITRIECGKEQNCRKQPRKDSGEWAVLTQGAITNRYFDASQNRLLTASEPEADRIEVHRGDLLFSRTNSYELVGATAYVFEDCEKLLLPGSIFKLRYDGPPALGVYLCYLFNDLNFQNNIRRLVRGTLKFRSSINQENLKGLKLPLPSRDLLEKFYEAILRIQERETIFRKSLNQYESFYSFILSEIFRFDFTFDLQAELERLLNKIDLDEKEHDFGAFERNGEILKKLVRRVEEHEFENQELYDRAIRVLMHCLKLGKIRQEYRRTGIKLSLE